MISAVNLQPPLSGNKPSPQTIADYCFGLAVQLAQQAACRDEVPVGAVLWHPNHGVVSYAHNATRLLNRMDAHAEFLAMQQACQYLENHRLINAELFITLEPCLMCAGAMLNARIAHVHFLLPEPKTGAILSQTNILDLDCNHHTFYSYAQTHVHAQEYLRLLQRFFKSRRESHKKTPSS